MSYITQVALALLVVSLGWTRRDRKVIITGNVEGINPIYVFKILARCSERLRVLGVFRCWGLLE